MTRNAAYRIVVIPGNGIGREVAPEGIWVLEIAGGNSVSPPCGRWFCRLQSSICPSGQGMEEDERLNSWKGISILTNTITPCGFFHNVRN